MTGSTISTTISKEVLVVASGTGIYLTPLSITSTGRINGPVPSTSFQTAGAIYVNVTDGAITNSGVVSGAIPVSGSYSAPAIFSVTALNLVNAGTITGQSGVDLQDGGTVTNSRTISGLDTRGDGGYGVRLADATLQNTGVVYGKSYGVINQNTGMVSNNGTISGLAAGLDLASNYLQTGGTLVNTGRILGNGAGVTETSALITNSGTIGGQTYGIRVSWGGTITNSGLISAGVDGVLLLNQQYQQQYETSFTNTGSVQGGYFGLALNFAEGTNAAGGQISGTTFGAGVGDVGYLLNAGGIYGTRGGLAVESGGRALNDGTIRSGQLGVDLFYNSNLTNAASGLVYSQNTAALNQAAYLVNDGTIAGNAYGLKLISGGIAVNYGTIRSNSEAVYLSTLSPTGSPDFLNNQGQIYGLSIGAGLGNGTVYNYGTIQAQQFGATLVAGTYLNNAGNMFGGRYGVLMQGGTLNNSGSIGSSTDGIRITRGYIATGGTISGAKYSIYGTSFALTVDPGAVFSGNVLDKTKNSLLNLAGSTPGTLSGIGTSLSGFKTIDFAPGAHWLLGGNSAGLSASEVINGFEQGDTIVLSNFSASSESFVANRGLILANSAGTVTLDIIGSFATANFGMTSSGATTTVFLQANAPCFVTGTRILTPDGEIPVEDLAAGDSVITQTGEDRPIIWAGKRSIDLRRHAQPEQAQPVCIRAGALAEGVPRRDLWVSPDHALLIDGFLIPAQLLINHSTIYRGALSTVTYHHLELSEHAVLFAEAAPAESYLETGNRDAFEDAGGLTLHPDFSAISRRANGCAPMLLEGEKLQAIRQRHLLRQREVAAAAPIDRGM